MNAYTDVGVELLALVRDYADMLASLLKVAPPGTNQQNPVFRQCLPLMLLCHFHQRWSQSSKNARPSLPKP